MSVFPLAVNNECQADSDCLSSVAYSVLLEALSTRKISLLAETICSVKALKVYIKRVIYEESQPYHIAVSGGQPAADGRRPYMEVKEEPLDGITATIPCSNPPSQHPQMHTTTHLNNQSSITNNNTANTAAGSVQGSTPPGKKPTNSASRSRGQKDVTLTCEHCGYTTFRNDRFTRHLMSHSRDKPFKCTECSFSAVDRWHLNRHLKSRAHSLNMGEKSPKKCDVCDYTTDKGGRLARHKLTHSQEKPFTCTYQDCSYKAAQKTTLDRHLLTHTGEKPFKCRMCDYAAADAKSLRFHSLQKHLADDVQVHRCDTCDYSTPIYRYLQLHLRTHSESRPYLCDACGYSAKRLQGLYKHYRSIHGWGGKDADENPDFGEDEADDAYMVESSSAAVQSAPSMMPTGPSTCPSRSVNSPIITNSLHLSTIVQSSIAAAANPSQFPGSQGSASIPSSSAEMFKAYF